MPAEKTIIKCSQSYKLIVPKKVEEKIRRLLNRVYNIEWSGILFYNYTGSFTNKDLVITCEDILPLNIGSTGYTEFEVTPDILYYMTDKGLLDCQMGLIHSHHHMGAFFSGTDVNTLYAEGTDRNNFVSLIVDNAGTYQAAITHKEHNVINRHVVSSCPFFDKNNVAKEFNDKVEEDKVYYNMLDVVVEKTEAIYDLDAQIDKLQSDFNVARKAIEAIQFPKGYDPTYKPAAKWNAPKPIQKTIDFHEESYKMDYEPSITKEPLNDSEDIIDLPNEVVMAAVAQMVTGNITAKKLPDEKTLAQFDTRYLERCRTKEELEVLITNVVNNVIDTMSNHFAPSYDPNEKIMFLASSCIDTLFEIQDYIPHIYPIINKELESYVN